MPRVLYTKEIEPEHLFLKESGLNWTFQSFIQIQETPFDPAAFQSEWLFFTSAHGVSSLLSRWHPSQHKIACLGASTAQAFGNVLTPGFIGNGDVEQVAKDFKERLKNERVTFVEGNLNRRTIAEALPKEQCFYIQTYQTKLVRTALDKQDVYFFTSPSNVDGFLLDNDLPDKAKIIAIGETTQRHLAELGFQAYIPNSYTHSDQLDAIKAVIGS